MGSGVGVGQGQSVSTSSQQLVLISGASQSMPLHNSMKEHDADWLGVAGAVPPVLVEVSGAVVLVSVSVGEEAVSDAVEVSELVGVGEIVEVGVSEMVEVAESVGVSVGVFGGVCETLGVSGVGVWYGQFVAVTVAQ